MSVAAKGDKGAASKPAKEAKASTTTPQTGDEYLDSLRDGRKTHAFFKAPKTLEDLLAGRNAIAEWAKITYGWLGRSPDYKASFLATLGANAQFYDPYSDNARRWYKYSQERVPFVNHAIMLPPVDRDRPPNEVADVCCHLE